MVAYILFSLSIWLVLVISLAYTDIPVCGKVNPQPACGNGFSSLRPHSSLVKCGDSLLDSLIRVVSPFHINMKTVVLLSQPRFYMNSQLVPHLISALIILPTFNTAISNWGFHLLSCNLLSCVDFLIGGWVNSHILENLALLEIDMIATCWASPIHLLSSDGRVH